MPKLDNAISTANAMQLLGVDVATFAQHTRDPNFPRPTIRENVPHWFADEILAFKDHQIFKKKFVGAKL